MNKFPTWPNRALGAIKKLFEPLQDIDVYIEDSNDEVFYRSLLKFVCGDRVRIAKVYSLGGREKVIEAAASYVQNQRKALFIIDADLYLARGVPPLNIANLHQHEAYCIENLLVCENAISTLLSQEAVVDEEDAKRRLNFTNWIGGIEQKLVELFTIFATSQGLSTGLPTVSEGINGLITKSNGATALDLAKVDSKINSIRLKIEAIKGKEAVKEEYEKIISNISTINKKIDVVSGKDFLLPLLDFQLQREGCRIKRKSLRIRLSALGDRERFNNLFNALEKAAKT